MLGTILSIGLTILLFVIILAIGAFFIIFNSLITLKNRVENAWAQIDVQLKKRHDLIPNLVETVKGYASHERAVFENVTKARAAMANATTVKDKAEADNMLTGALKTLFAVAENYPLLRANENFKMLQEELSGIESKIAYARQFYNDSVLEYNIKIQKIPSNIVASILRFIQKDYFKVVEAEKEVPKVKF